MVIMVIIRVIMFIMVIMCIRVIMVIIIVTMVIMVIIVIMIIVIMVIMFTVVIMVISILTHQCYCLKKRTYLKISRTIEEPLCKFLKGFFQTFPYSRSHFSWVKDLKGSVKITQAHTIQNMFDVAIKMVLSQDELWKTVGLSIDQPYCFPVGITVVLEKGAKQCPQV